MFQTKVNLFDAKTFLETLDNFLDGFRSVKIVKSKQKHKNIPKHGQKNSTNNFVKNFFMYFKQQNKFT